MYIVCILHGIVCSIANSKISEITQSNFLDYTLMDLVNKLHLQMY